MNLRFFGFAALLGLAGVWLFQRDYKRVHATEPRILTASFYGAECAGKRTASGEIFDPRKYTAASWEYYGKTLRVSHKGKSICVVVNDKGPGRKYLKTRELDLSQAAFEKLAPLKQGLVRVTVEIL